MCLGLRQRLGRGDAVFRRVAVGRRRHQVVEDTGRAYDPRLSRLGQRNLDDFDAEQRGIGILRGADAARELAGRSHRGLARDVDVDVVPVLGIHQQRMGMRPATGLDVADVPGISNVADVEDPEPPEPLGADRVLDTLSPAVETRGEVLARDEEQVLVDRDVALRAGTDVGGFQGRPAGICDVPHLIAVEVSLDRIVAGEGQVGVDPALGKLGRWRRLGYDSKVPGCFGRIRPPGTQTYPRVRLWRWRRSIVGRRGTRTGRGR